MTTILAFVFVLGVLVFVHELGHFMMAKKIGVRVLKFQLGFNPTVVSFTRGDTEYGIGAVPLGGYVKMAGENPDEPRSGRDDEFLSKSKWERFQVMIMGPAMNLALAVVLMVVVFVQGADVPAFQDRAPVIGSVTKNSPAEAAGLKPGDRILSIADRDVDTWERFFIIVGMRRIATFPSR
jgi:regulator of sigma E protease